MRLIVPDLPMPIRTPRLIIRPISVEDGVVTNQAIVESFDVLHRFVDWANKLPTLNESEEYAKLAAKNWILRTSEEPWLQLCIFDRETDQFIGGTGLHNFNWAVPCVETGYWVRTSRANQGLMTEAVNAITQYAFRQLRVKRIAITCDRDNIRSKKIPERLGYRLEATLKCNRVKPVTGEVSDTLVYARYDNAGLPDLAVDWG